MKNSTPESYKFFSHTVSKPKLLSAAKILVFAAMLIAYGSLITYKITLPAGEDLPRQIQNGKDIMAGNFDVIYKNVYSYSQPDHQFDNHHWFYGVLMYWLHGLAGYAGIVVFKIVMLPVHFQPAFLDRAQAGRFLAGSDMFYSDPYHIAWPRCCPSGDVQLSVCCTFSISSYRSEKNPKSKKIFWLIPIQLLWANIHILFPAGIAIVGAYWAHTIVHNWKGAAKNYLVRKLTIVLLAVTLISFANPLGISGVIYSLKANSTGAASSVFSAETRSIADVFKSDPKSDYPGAVIFVPMLILLGASFVLAFRKKNIFYLMLALAFGLLSFRIIRGLPLSRIDTLAGHHHES